MKKILIILPGMYYGGMERVSFIAREILSNNGYSVDYLTLYRGNPDYNPGFEFVSLDCEVSKSKLGKIITTAKRIYKLRKYIRETEPDILLVYGQNANFISVVAKTHQRVILGIRSYDWLYKYFFDYKTEKFVYKKADVVVSVSRLIQKEAEDKFDIPKKKSEYLYNPYDIELINDKANEQITEIEIPDGKFVIVSAGRLEHQKAFYHLIKAISLVKKDVVVYIMGHGSQKENLQQLIVELELQDKIFLIGGQSNPYKFMKRADVYTLTSITEGFPNALVEAMSLGTPVICADCMSGPREILTNDDIHKKTDSIEFGEYGILVKEMADTRNYNSDIIEDTEQFFARAIDTILDDKKLRQDYATKSIIRATSFSYQSFEKKLIKIIEKYSKI